MNYLITNGKVLTETEGQGFGVVQTDIYIKDGIIQKIGAGVPDDVYEVIDANNQLVMPGLINMHTHAYMSCLKNYADDVPFNKWLFEKIMPVEDKLSSEAAYWSSLLACIEMIRTGTTCFVDMHMFQSQSCRAATHAGMRAFIGRGLVGEDLYEDGNTRFIEAITEKNECGNNLIQFILSPHAIYSCSERMLRQINEEAYKLGMLKQIHLSESTFEVETAIQKYGKTPVEFLSDIGFLDSKTILAHCVKLTDRDIELINENKASVVTNPASNAKLGNGIAPVVSMINQGVNVCLGTDSVASNNTLNMFREMGLLSLLHKASQDNPTALSSTTVLRTATVNSAKALGFDRKLGAIVEGAYADLIFVDLTSPSLFPNNNIISSLCYSANGTEVSSVMINGKFVMRNGAFTTIDIDRVYYEIEHMVKKYL